MATVPVKGLPGILGLFYNNSKGARKGEESKQPIKPRSSPKLGDTVLTPTPATLETNNPQYIEDKGYKAHPPIYRETISLLPSSKLLIEQDKVYIIAQPIPALGTPRTPYFIGQNVSQFVK
jgi:hypothetical protein